MRNEMLIESSNGNPMRVCFVSHSAYMGGAERALLEAIRSLTNRGVTCHVILPYGGPLCEELSKMNVAFQVVKYQPWVYRGNMSWWWRTRCLLISLVMVIPTSRAIVRWKSTIVYTNTITIFTGAMAAMLTRRPHIWNIHEFGDEDHGLKFLFGKSLSLGFMGRLSALCIAASKAIADALQGFIPPSKLKVIYQSVSISSPVTPMQKKSSAFKCIFVGNIAEGKNQEEAVRAVAELAKKGMTIELYIIGDGYEDYIAHLNNIIEKNGIQNNVRFLGYQNDAYSYMCIADVVLMCSRSEGFGRVTVEGMLAGKAIIGARSGATPELIQDGVTGLLYTLGAYKELAQKIEYLFDNPARAELMGKNAREWALEKFSEKRYGADLMQALLDVGESGAKHGKSKTKARSNGLGQH
jgi:glycosyltransferase involved in cell wall biosynthesis